MYICIYIYVCIYTYMYKYSHALTHTLFLSFSFSPSYKTFKTTFYMKWGIWHAKWRTSRMKSHAMGWLWLAGSIKLQVSFAKESYTRDNKREYSAKETYNFTNPSNRSHPIYMVHVFRMTKVILYRFQLPRATGRTAHVWKSHFIYGSCVFWRASWEGVWSWDLGCTEV